MIPHLPGDFFPGSAFDNGLSFPICTPYTLLNLVEFGDSLIWGHQGPTPIFCIVLFFEGIENLYIHGLPSQWWYFYLDKIYATGLAPSTASSAEYNEVSPAM